MRFGVLRKNVAGISSRVLTERLRTLENKGFVFRHYQPTIPPAVTYGITDRMKDIEKVLAQLEGLARKWQGEGTQASPKTTVTRTDRGTNAHTPEAFSCKPEQLPPTISLKN